MKIKEKHARFGLAVPLASVLLLPSTGFAATNLPQSDAHQPKRYKNHPQRRVGRADLYGELSSTAGADAISEKWKANLGVRVEF